MSTNYYFTPREWTEPEPDTILDIVNPNRREQPMIHLGKRASGWKFMLHVYPEHGIDTWSDWKRLINSRKDWHVVSEYHEELTIDGVEKVMNDIRDGKPHSRNVEPDGAHYTCHSGEWC